MALLLDIFGFLSVVLRGVVLTTQSLTVGGIVFLALLARPLRPELGCAGDEALERCRRLLIWSALAFALTELGFVLLQSLALAGTVAISLGHALGAEVAHFGLIPAAAAFAARLGAAG